MNNFVKVEGFLVTFVGTNEYVALKVAPFVADGVDDFGGFDVNENNEDLAIVVIE